MTASVSITVNGATVTVPEGCNVAAAVAKTGASFRRSLSGEPRAALCGMGVCFECRVTIDDVAQQQACMLPVRAGMRVQTDA